MVSRKSLRVRKSPVVYQAAEQIPKTPKNVTPKPVPPRRTFSRDIELQMECMDDDLSPAQLKAIKDAQKEHEKANDLIKEVRAGNILVPSSQPNTFTIVPPKPPPQPPKPTPPAPVSAPVKAQVLTPSPPKEQRGLPPPRPAQFLNKQIQDMNKGSKPDVILISDVHTQAKAGMTKIPVSQVPSSQMQIRQMGPVLASQGDGVTPQQVYKFVSLPSNMPANVIQNQQWALRPLLTVPPQQQSQLSFLATTQQGMGQLAPVRGVTWQPSQARMPAPRNTNISAPGSQGKSIEVGSKRPAQSEAAASQPPAKKRAHKEGEVSDSSGNWVPLDEYYYGTNEGDASYTEEKGEYRFKCWYCCKMLYNNVRAMQHIQGHIDASKQQNIDLSDLTQCKYCYKQFDTPFEMQTHVEKVHLSNKVLMCRICERDFATPRELMVHMKSNHHACEMPYVCHLCQFRSSMYSDVVDHFKKKHDSSNHMLCLYCLRAFEVKFVSQGWGQTQTYYGHLLKHQSKTMNKKCVVCRLTFFNVIDVKNHRRTCHVSSVQDMKALSQGKSDSAQKQKKGSTLKSLNAPSVSRIQDYGDIAFPRATSKSKCIECKMMMSTTDHYKKYVHCSMCRFATSCSVAYANHMMGFHSGQMSSLNLNIPWERPMKVPMYCICGFSSKFGNKVANHLVYCAKWTCSTKKLAQSSTGAGKAGKDKKEGSLLGMLGLVQKSTVATNEETDEIRNVEKPKPVPEKKVLDKVEVVKKNADDIKPDTKPVKETAEPVMPILKKESEEKHVSDEKNKAVVKENKADRNQIIDQNVSEDLPQKDTEKTEKSTQKVETIKISDSGRDKIETYISNENLTEARGDTGESQEEPETVDKENPTETSEIQKDIELDKSEKDPMEADEVEQIHEVHEEAHAISDEAKHSDEDDQAKDEEEMDTDTVNEPGVTPVDSQNDTCEETKQADDATEPVELIDETDKSLATDTLEETMVTEEKELKKDLIDEEKAEPLKQTDIEDIETKEAAAESLKEDENYTEEEQGPEDDTEDHLKKTEELTETETDKPALAESTDESYPAELDKDISQPITTDDILTGEEGKIEESEAAETTKDQDMVKSAENEQKDSEVHKEEEAEDKEASASQASEIKGDDDDTETKCLDDEKKADDQRKSSERSAEGRGSVDRHSSDSRESSEQHSRDRQDSHERHHSGSGDRSHHDGRSHDSDKYRHDNRSHGSNRSDSYHGNRSSYDSNRDRDRSYDRDRDRSYDRDRDRDYNRNRNYRDNRHGDNRSGGYGYQDNRGQGYGGGQGYRNSQGQYGGYQGNRGDHHQDRNRGGHQQDRNYNRNHQNRGGYNQNRGGNNQNYRGGYRGGYY